ncbi:tyrosine-protein phosphatase 1 [[Candida] railenensis]|uniref:Tyrosine-protein phosphatase 1 n=1 Tax=[Candida] railenensis TaxID=45579 RepID=A0A9P0QQY5_9ASCO|nr:tyrosine-protein phosphatase 1 [[Candida] railenensis]
MGFLPSRNASAQHREIFLKLQELEGDRIRDAMDYRFVCSKSPPSARISVVPPSLTYNVANASQNRDRNRYSNVFPWDCTRVRLATINPEKYSDYINASHIRLPNDQKYIAAQGPLEETISQFWWMCYNESERNGNDVVVIGMVTPLTENGIVKCSSYWPSDINEPMDLSESLAGDGLISPNSKFSVHLLSQTFDKEGDFITTELNLRFDSKVKKVYHLYYYKWADTKVPPSIDPLVSLSNKINQVKESYANADDVVPIIHCSAGVGRTGTFIVVDYLIQCMKKTGGIPKDGDIIGDTVSQLREQRMMMVQTIHQYEYLYRALEQIKKLF